MLRFLLSLLLLAGWSDPVFCALSPKAMGSGIPAAPDGQRFLFIVQTTSSMEDLQSATEATIFEMLRSGIDGQMRVGDTYGLWTYNKETHPRQFPMTVWDSRKSTQLGTIAAAFLNHETYEKSANIKELMLHLSSVVRSVSNLTVFIISDGKTDMQGTPFDKDINAEYRKQSHTRRVVGRPYVTTLVVRGGWFVESSVNVGGKPIQLPDRPDPQVAARATITNGLTAALPAATAAPATEKANASSTGPAAPPSAAGVAPKKVIQIITRSNVPPAPTPTLVDQVNPAASNLVTTTPPPSAATTGTVVAAVAAPKVSVVQPGSVSNAPTVAAAPAPVAPAPVPVPAVSVQPPTSLAPTAVAAPMEAVTGSTAGRIGDRLAAIVPSEPTLVVAAREITPTSTPAAMATAVTAPSRAGDWKWMLGFGVLLAGATSLLLVTVFIRGRSSAQGSLITQSMNRR